MLMLMVVLHPFPISRFEMSAVVLREMFLPPGSRLHGTRCGELRTQLRIGTQRACHRGDVHFGSEGSASPG